MKTKIFFAAFCIALSSFSGKAQSLKVGDTAPPLHIIKWLKGKEVSSFEKGKVYVVDFGYVACPPCRAAIPHLTALSQKYKKQGNVEVISVFTAESDLKNPKNLKYIKPIQDLVNFMGDKMDYTVAIDVPAQKSRELWKLPNYFPQFFLIDKEGKIALTNPSLSELDFAVESVVNTGVYKKSDYLQNAKSQQDSLLYSRLNPLEEMQWQSIQDGKYKQVCRTVDSLISTGLSDEFREKFLFHKFRAKLMMNDSISADSCLLEIVGNKKSGWESLHGKFQFISPPMVHRPIFNYDRYLMIADKAINEVGTARLRSVQLSIKAKIMYDYNHNTEEARAELHKALKLVKDSDVPLDIVRIEGELSLFEKRVSMRKQADIDWLDIEKCLSEVTREELNKVLAEKGNVAQHQLMVESKKKSAQLAEDFWKKYPLHERRFEALYIFLKANFTTVPWIGDISEALSTELNAKEKRLVSDYLTFPERNLAYGHAYFRMFPRDLSAEQNWVNKGNEMVHQAMFGLGSTELLKESLNWALISRDWRSASFSARNLPSKDERLVDGISRLEGDYWKGVAIQYWESFWIRLNQHIKQYPDFPIIADRAADILGGTQSHAPELVASYWQRLIDTYGDPQNPLAKKEGIVALVSRAQDQLHVLKIGVGLMPVEMKFIALDGRQVDLENYRGKVVLIDFWASWCKPCVGDMPKLKSIYDKYHEKGFEMIGICLDEESKREEVKQLLLKNSIIGPQRFEGKGFDGDRYKQLYGIGGLPTVWLLDKNGMLVSTSARGEELTRLLNKYLGPSK